MCGELAELMLGYMGWGRALCGSAGDGSVSSQIPTTRRVVPPRVPPLNAALGEKRLAEVIGAGRGPIVGVHRA